MSLEDELTDVYNNFGLLGVSALTCGVIGATSGDDFTSIVAALSFGGINGLYAGMQNVAADITSFPIRKRVRTLLQSFSHGILATGAAVTLPWAQNDVLSAVSSGSAISLGLAAAGVGYVGTYVYGESRGWFDDRDDDDLDSYFTPDPDPDPGKAMLLPAPDGSLPMNDYSARVSQDSIDSAIYQQVSLHSQ